MAIKAVAARPWGERPHTATTWYEAYTGDEEIARGVRFVLSVPGVARPVHAERPGLTLATVAGGGPLRADERRRARRGHARHRGGGPHLPHARHLTPPPSSVAHAVGSCWRP